MPAIHITRAAVAQLPIKAHTYVAYDSKLTGFGCKVTPSGRKSWIVEYRPNGGGRRVAKRRIKIGGVEILPLEQARKSAQEILAKVQLGSDVASERKNRRAAPTINELVTRYLAEEIHPTRKSGTVANYTLLFRKHVLPEFGNVSALDVTRSRVEALHRKIGLSRPVTANRVLTLVSGLYSWAINARLLPDGVQPAKTITRFGEQGCERFLTGSELTRLGEALEEAETMGLPWEPDLTRVSSKHAPKPENRRELIARTVTNAIRLLLLTGCRLREILHLEWSSVDLERGILFLPDSKTGRKPVFLSAAAMKLLTEFPREGRFVIPGTVPNQPRHDLKRPWIAIRRRAGLQGVRLHDLRHTFAAEGAGLGLGLPIIGKLLGHRSIETTSKYAHLDVHPLKSAADRIAGPLAAAIGLNAES